MKNFNKKQAVLMLYKLLHDLSFILILFLTGLLLIEEVVPEFLASYISLPWLIIAILSLFSVIGHLSRKLNFNYEPVSIRKKKSIPFFVIIIILLLGGSMLRFSLWQNLLILLSMLFLLFLFYRIIFRAEP